MIPDFQLYSPRPHFQAFCSSVSWVSCYEERMCRRLLLNDVHSALRTALVCFCLFIDLACLQFTPSFHPCSWLEGWRVHWLLRPAIISNQLYIRHTSNLLALLSRSPLTVSHVGSSIIFIRTTCMVMFIPRGKLFMTPMLKRKNWDYIEIKSSVTLHCHACNKTPDHLKIIMQCINFECWDTCCNI